MGILSSLFGPPAVAFTMATSGGAVDTITIDPNSPNTWDTSNIVSFCQAVGNDELAGENMSLAGTFCNNITTILDEKSEALAQCNILGSQIDGIMGDISDKMVSSGIINTDENPNGKELSILSSVSDNAERECYNAVSTPYNKYIMNELKATYPGGMTFPTPK